MDTPRLREPTQKFICQVNVCDIDHDPWHKPEPLECLPVVAHCCLCVCAGCKVVMDLQARLGKLVIMNPLAAAQHDRRCLQLQVALSAVVHQPPQDCRTWGPHSCPTVGWYYNQPACMHAETLSNRLISLKGTLRAKKACS